MAFTPTIIKPSRTHANLPELDISRAKKNHQKGIETNVVLDLNILSKMNEIVLDPDKYETSGLKATVSMFNRMPLVLSPGFAISEVSNEYLDALWSSWEVFLSTYCPNYVDASNATKEKRVDGRGKKFEKLPDGDRHMQSIAYLAILAIHVIAKRSVHLSPERKFEEYVEFMCTRADILSAVEAEVAKHCFFDRTTEKSIAFRNFSEIIHKNFMKSGASEIRLRNALNSARDINYYRIVAARSNESLDGKIQDTWLLTADEGLKNLAQSIYFVPGFDGSDSKAAKIVRNQSQKTSSYWRFCDEFLSERLVLRNDWGTSVRDPGCDERHFRKIFDCITELEGSVREIYT